MINEFYQQIGEEWSAEQTFAHPVWEARIPPALKQVGISSRADEGKDPDEVGRVSSDEPDVDFY